MIPLGLSVADWREYRAELRTTHRRRVRVAAMTLEGEATADLSGYLDDGQVNGDGSAPVTRSLSLTLHDPKRSLPFDTDSPATSALFMDRMLRVSDQVLVGDEWVPCPVFTGPVTKLDRDGDTINVECQGKEVLAMGASWAPMTLHKGMKKTDAIRRILEERAGETRFDIPDIPARLPKAISLGRESVPWRVAQRIAHGMGRQLFYDGAGTCRLRRRPNTPGFAFSGEHHVVTPPQISYSSDLVNAVFVLGGDPKGPKTQVYAAAVAPRNHPLSPWRLGRNDVPRYLLPDGQIIRDDSIKTLTEAQDVADRRLYDGLLQAVDVSFDSVPVPFLDIGDLCHVKTDDLSVMFRLGQFSLPLTGSGAMSVGYHRRVTRPRPRRNRA